MLKVSLQVMLRSGYVVERVHLGAKHTHIVRLIIMLNVHENEIIIIIINAFLN